RMKTDWPCRINAKRKSQELKSYKIGKESLVQIVHAPDIASEAVFVAEKIKAIMHDHPKTRLSDFAVVSRHGISFPYLVAVRMALAKEDIGFCYSIKSSSGFPMFMIREIQTFIQYLDENKKSSKRPFDLKKEVMALFAQKNMWTNQVEQILELWCKINSDMEISIARAKDFVLETLLEEKREQKTGNGVFMGTVHSVKGMEFPFVFILDGGWEHHNMEEERRLFYVGMTRAEKNLYLCLFKGSDNSHICSLRGNPFTYETTADLSVLKGFDEGMTVSILGMEDLYISFPGFFPNNHEIHTHLSALETGEKVNLIEQKDRIRIVDTKNHIIASLSKKGSAKWRNQTHTILNARVLGIVKRQPQENEDDEYNNNLKVESWELPIIEILHKKI
ncbi:MAG: ATP-dependent helicase, partial [Desulfobacteraceae bacterium]|nr:ATP-dependent helicase [Desulfobacteraceae bacterium]